MQAEFTAALDAYVAERAEMRVDARMRALGTLDMRMEHFVPKACAHVLSKAIKPVSKAQISPSACAERSDAQPLGLGLVSNATSDTSLGLKRPLREKLLINREASRVKRMRTAISHVSRLLHFDAHSERHAQFWNKKFLTLTYADAKAWRPGHFSSFRKAMGQWASRRDVRLRFVWVAELQQRGALHYHVVVWLPKGKFLPKPEKWWPHGMTNIKTAESPISYIAKYASKTTAAQAAQYPKGARMHGHGGLDPESRRHVRYWQAPFWVRDALGGRADIRKVSGGYMDKFTGEFLPSPWRVYVAPGGEVWAYRVDLTESVH